MPPLRATGQLPEPPDAASPFGSCGGNDSLQDGLTAEQARATQKQYQEDAQKRHNDKEEERFAKAMTKAATNYARETLFHVIKFADDEYINRIKNGFFQHCVTGDHAEDSIVVRVFNERVFPTVQGTYKGVFRSRRRSINQAMEKITVGASLGLETTGRASLCCINKSS